MNVALAVLLAFSIATLWVPDRWAVSAVEAAAFLLTICTLARAHSRIAPIVLAPAFLCAWAAIQLVAQWTVVPAATVDAFFYWLAAACLIYLGSQIAARGIEGQFLNWLLAIGTVICIAGTIQLFTSNGNVFWIFPSGFDRRVIGPFVSPNNYAAFVELLIPIALTRRDPWRLPVAAVLAATVVASGSRTGAILVAAEILVLLCLGSRRKHRLLTPATRLVPTVTEPRPQGSDDDRKPATRLRDLTIFLAVAAATTAILGPQFLLARFTQADPFAVRREFLESTLAMFRAQPWHGFGFGTWPWTYPHFALIDTGDFANHAHNEWAQWAAEGGIPALAAMLALLIWIAPRALRSLWAVGLLAVLAHSAVDYPFLRLGLSAWIFVIAGLLAARAAPALHAPRLVLCALLLLATWQVTRIAYANALFRQATPASVGQAVLITNRAEYHFALAQLDPAHAIPHLEAALKANPFATPARIALAQEHESQSDGAPAAERLLLEAAQRDHQFAPAWALANFYFRRNSPDAFWTWTRKAAAMSFADRRALFDLCFLVSDNPATVFTRLGRPELAEPFLRYLTAQRGAASASETALSLARHPNPSERAALLDYVDVAIAEAHPEPAWRVWNFLAAPPAGRGFDWRIPPTDGVYITRSHAEWRVELSGREAEQCELLSLPLPGAAFTLRFEYRTENLARPGLSFDAIALEPSPEWRAAAAPATTNWMRLTYRRPSGSVRAEGVLWLRNLRLEAAARF